MKDDTKEILEGIASGKYDSGVIYDIDIKALLDYITNLQEENKNLQIDKEVQVLSRYSPPKEDKKIVMPIHLNTDYYKDDNYGAISKEEIVLDIQSLKTYICELIDILNGEDIKEIPQFEGTLDQLEKLSIRGEDNEAL